jgi:hypothetical protein
MSTPIQTPLTRPPRSPRLPRLPTTMPGQLGKATALLAAIVLFLAALPILTMITMSFSAADTLEFPPHAYGLHWYPRRGTASSRRTRATRSRWAPRSARA